MRILHVLDHSLPMQSGYAFRTAAILKHQRALGWETLQLTSGKHRSTSAEAAQVDGMVYDRTPAGGVLARVPWLREWAVITRLEGRILDLARRSPPDLLHAHSPCLNGLAALRAARRLGVPVVYELRASWEDAAIIHGTTREGSLRYRASRALETRVLHRAHAITTICDGLRDEILARGLEPGRVTVIKNGVDPARFGASPEPDAALAGALGLAGRPVIGFIGSFYAYEGLELLLDALPSIAARAPDVGALLVGGGFEEAKLRRVCQRAGLHGRVVMPGRVPHAEVQRYYDLIDILVYPRLPTRLTELVTPLKPLEAMAAGRLVVASDVGGHRELIANGVNGVLFRAGDPAALADAVCSLLADRQSWDERRRRARAYIERERDWSSIVGRYADVYASALSSSGARVTA